MELWNNRSCVTKCVVISEVFGLVKTAVYMRYIERNMTFVKTEITSPDGGPCPGDVRELWAN